MPFFGIGLHIGDTEGDSQVGPSGPNGVYKLEDNSGFYLTAANDYLAF